MKSRQNAILLSYGTIVFPSSRNINKSEVHSDVQDDHQLPAITFLWLPNEKNLSKTTITKLYLAKKCEKNIRNNV